MQTDNWHLTAHSVFTFKRNHTPASLGAGAVAEQSFTSSNSPRPLKSPIRFPLPDPALEMRRGFWEHA